MEISPACGSDFVQRSTGVHLFNLFKRGEVTRCDKASRTGSPWFPGPQPFCELLSESFPLQTPAAPWVEKSTQPACCSETDVNWVFPQATPWYPKTN